MIAKQLESILSSEAANTDFQSRAPADLVQRFQSLRGVGALPRGRGKNAQHLNSTEVVAGILSLISDKPSFAGFAAKMLMTMRPIGGPFASFFKAENFGRAVMLMLEDAEALETVLEVRISGSEIYANGYGRASITYSANGETRIAYFISEMATSLMQQGAEETYSPQDLISSVINETILFRRLFQRISSEMKVLYPENAFDHLMDPTEEQLEEIKKAHQPIEMDEIEEHSQRYQEYKEKLLE